VNSILSEVVAPTLAIVVLMATGATLLRWVIRARSRPGSGEDESQRVTALEDEVHLLTSQMAELAERLDFAERVLAERRERKLGAGQ